MAGPKSKRDADGVSPLERQFVAEFLIDLNAINAYKRARLPLKVTTATANTNSWKMMKRPQVQRLIAEHRDKAMAAAELSVADTLQQLRRFLMYDVRKLYSPEGAPLHITELSDDMAAAIVGVEVVTKGNSEMGFGEVTKYKLADKVAALDKAMRYHALFEKDNRQKADPVTELLAAIYGTGSRLTVKE